MVLLGLIRGLQLAATLSAFGALLFRSAVAPAALARVDAGSADRISDSLTLIVRASVVAALVSAAAWLPLEAAAMSGAGNVAETAAAVPVVLLQTVFGHALSLRLLLLGTALLVLGSGRHVTRVAVAAGLAGIACILQAGMGHSAAAESLPLPAAVMVHVVAAGAWLGGLLPLWLMVRRLPHDAASVAARRFSPLGIAAVSVLAATAVLQGTDLIGGIPGLLDTAYGRLALAKTMLFALLIGLAAANRRVFTPRLARSATAGQNLERSIVAETGLGLLVVLAASSMAVLPPGSMQMAQGASSAVASAMASDHATGGRRTESPIRLVPRTLLAARQTAPAVARYRAAGHMACS